MKICSVEGCGKPRDAKGYCGMHYMTFRRHGDPGHKTAEFVNPGCSVPGCDKIHFGLGFCNLHYTRFKNHGDPNFRYNPPLLPPDENNMRRCRKCAVAKPMEEFGKTPKGFAGNCKSCTKNRADEWRRSSPEVQKRINLRAKKAYWENPEKYRASNRRHRNPEKAREKHLKRKYGLSDRDYKNLLDQQKGVCAICKQHEIPKLRFLSVDHDHPTGKVRGLLCKACNTAIGLLKDSIPNLSAAIEYLKRSDGGTQ